MLQILVGGYDVKEEDEVKKIFALTLMIFYLTPLQSNAKQTERYEMPPELFLIKTEPRCYPVATYNDNYLLYYHDKGEQRYTNLSLNMLDCRNFSTVWKEPYELNLPMFNCCIEDSTIIKLYKNYVIVLTSLKSPHEYFDAIVCLNAIDGEMVWNQNIGLPMDMYYQIIDDKIFIYGGPDGSMLCINVNNGSILWQDEIRNLGYSVPDKISTIDGERFIFLNQNLCAYSHTSKKVLWGATLNDGCYVDWYGGYLHMLCSGQPIFVDKKVWLLVPDRTNDPSKDCCFSFQKRDFDSGEIIFKRRPYSSIFLVDGKIIASGMVCDKNCHLVEAFDPVTNETYWSKDFGSYSYIVKHMKIAGDDVFQMAPYIPGEEMPSSYLVAIDLKTGNEKWRLKFPHKTYNIVNVGNKFFTEIDNTMNIYSSEKIPDSNKQKELVFSIDKKSYVLDGKESQTDSSPIIYKDSTYLPARYVLEPLGGSVKWDASKKIVEASLAKPGSKDKSIIEPVTYNTIEMTINNPTATVNGKKVQIDPKNPKITPIIKDGRTMVPLRFLAENLGCTVKWIAETKTIIVTYQP